MSSASLENRMVGGRAASSFGVKGLRSLQWRMNLGVLPSSSSSSVDHLRRVTADSRRTYARLRRRLLIDPHIHKKDCPDPAAVDNPLSQDPDSNWSRYFRNAELEKMVYDDLSRLYPEHGEYFQNAASQSMLRRVLLVWCLRHPRYGYRQGMHELLAPLLYVLHVDVDRLSEVRKTYNDQFTDTFDGISYLASNDSYNLQFRRFSDSAQENAKKVTSIDELDHEIQTIILLSDAYGVEGELGVVLSEKFMEHDAYCMFDALMGGSGGVVAMADFFYSPAGGPLTSLPPVIEASSALYHVLSIVDSSIHSHLVELGVEPQFFALRWLRVLFGREFVLDNLLVIWDEIFASDNTELNSRVVDDEVGFKILNSRRGSFIAAVAVSMILYMRSSILATETATSALQKLLKFPENVNISKLIEKAKGLQLLALDSNITSSNTYSHRSYNHSESMPLRINGPSDFSSSQTPISVVPESYWEERWRDLQKAEEVKQGASEKRVSSRRRGWAEKIRHRLARTESDPSHLKIDSSKKDQKSFVRRSLLEDLSRVLGSEDGEDIVSNEDGREQDKIDDCLPNIIGVKKQEGVDKDFGCTTEESFSSGNDGSEENLSIFSDPTSPPSEANDCENGSETSIGGSDLHPDETDSHIECNIKDPMLPVSSRPEDLIVEHQSNEESTEQLTTESKECNDLIVEHQSNEESTEKLATVLKERKLLSDKFQWFWRFRRSAAGEGSSPKGGCSSQVAKPPNNECSPNNASSSVAAVVSCNSSNGTIGASDQKVRSVNNLGQSMLQYIQVIESAIQKDHGLRDSMEYIPKNVINVKGESTAKAKAALKELQKIGNILSEL